MKSISVVADQALIWVRPSALNQAFELRAGDEVLATPLWRAVAKRCDRAGLPPGNSLESKAAS